MAEPTAVRKARLDDNRARLRARVQQLRGQVDHDREQLSERVRELAGPDSPLARHPVATVAGGAGAGFLLARSPVTPVTPLKSGASVAGHGVLAGLRKEAEVVLGAIVSGFLGRAMEKDPGA